MKSTVFSSMGVVSIGILLILPGDATWLPFANRPAVSGFELDRAELLVAQCRGGRRGRARGPEDALIPYVISPRNTAVLNDRPDLFWNPIAGVSQYTISLMNGDTEIWTKEVNTNKIAYPTDMNALQPGIDYTLVIKAGNGRASTEEDTEPAFHLLSPTKAATVRQAETLLAAQSATEETVLLKADFYTGVELYSEAINTLETLVNQGTPSATMYRQLGDLYARSDLNIRAEPYYLDAIPLAEGNLEEQARAQAALAELYVAIEQNQEAQKYFTQAKENYEKLNNQLKVKEMQEQLAELTAQG